VRRGLGNAFHTRSRKRDNLPEGIAPRARDDFDGMEQAIFVIRQIVARLTLSSSAALFCVTSNFSSLTAAVAVTSASPLMSR
jgi:hypothetical protein